MPWAYRIHVPRRLVHSIAYGAFTGDDLRAHAAALRVDPEFSPDYMQLADFRAATRLELSVEDVRRQVPLNAFSPSARRAIVVSSEIAFAMSRMFGMLNDGSVCATRNLDEAWDWLGVPADAPERIAVEATYREYLARVAD